MTAIDFPNDPDLGDIYIVSGKAWRWSGTVWDLVGAISEGPQGPTGPVSTELGPTGPTGSVGFQGPTGPTGPAGLDGSGITILGSVANVAALPSSGNSAGDAYLVEADNEVYVWDVANSEWFSIGSIQGPTGPTGPTGVRGDDSTVPGPTGPTGPTGASGPAGVGYDGITIAPAGFSGGTLTGTLNKVGALVVGSTVRITSNASPSIFADGTIFSITGLDASITIFSDSTGGTLSSLTNPKVSLSGLFGATGPTGSDGTFVVSATAPSSPVEGNVWYNSDTGRQFVYYDSYWVESSPSVAGPTGPTIFPNAIINGAFEINQRGATGASPAANVPGYVFDRWFLISSEGNGTTSSQNFTPGNAIPGYESSNFVRLSTPITAKSTASESIIQRVENVRTFAGQNVTISFWAKSGSGTPSISIELNQNFGTGGSPSSEVNTYVNKTAISTSWTRYTATITVPSILGKTVGTTANTSYLELRIWCSAGSDFNARTNSLGNQNNTFDIWGVQLEPGTVATPFRRNAPSVQGELAACQRYYWRAQAAAASDRWGNGYTEATSSGQAWIPFPVEMRIPPTALEQSGTAGDYSFVTSGGVVTILTAVPVFARATKWLAQINLPVTSGPAAGLPLSVRAVNSNAFLGWSAEI
jgi:hypothetical protein